MLASLKLNYKTTFYHPKKDHYQKQNKKNSIHPLSSDLNKKSRIKTRIGYKK
jgi:hypothetical protein